MDAAPHTPAPQPTDIGIARLAAISFSVLALIMSLVAVAQAGGDGGSPTETRAGLVSVPVSMTEFAFTSDALEVAEGGTLSVTNDGEAQHTLAVEGTDLVTPTLNAGEADTVELGGLATGDYVIVCTIPGHKDLGMTGTLKVVPAGAQASGDGDSGDHSGHSGTMSPGKMTALDREDDRPGDGHPHGRTDPRLPRRDEGRRRRRARPHHPG